MKRDAHIKLTFLVLLTFFSTSWGIQCHAQGPLFVPAPGSPVTVGQGSGEVVLADLNRDGHLDMLTKHLLAQIVAVRLGDGKGHFEPFLGSSMRFSYQPGAITLGDVNNDSILDLGIASKEGDKENVRIFLGNGTTLAPRRLRSWSPMSITTRRTISLRPL